MANPVYEVVRSSAVVNSIDSVSCSGLDSIPSSGLALIPKTFASAIYLMCAIQPQWQEALPYSSKETLDPQRN